MRRIEDVFDVWFDSGSMPYAQVHYPFENREWFDEHAPADFIVEYIGPDARLVLRHARPVGALFDRPAFTGVACHGIVLGSDGQKMSKSLRNYPDVSEVFDRDGSDAMRGSSWRPRCCAAATSSSPRRDPRRARVPAAAVEHVVLLRDLCERRDHRRIRGALAHRLDERSGPLHPRADRRPRARRRRRPGALDSTTAAAKLRDFAEALTNWYVRRSRDRFWVG
jgi:isoleucyl-tRNA synthetase